MKKMAYKKTVSIINETAVQIYENLVGKTNKGFLLESYDKNYDRYVIMGKSPEAYICSRADEALVVTYQDGSSEELPGNPMESLKRFYSRYEVERPDGDLAFTGGLVGALGYDFVKYSETLPDRNPDDIGIETIQMMLVTDFIIMDHVAETLTAVSVEEISEAGKGRAAQKLEMLLEAAFANKEGASAAEASDTVRDGVVIKKSDTLPQYCEKVEKIKHYIREGHIFQTVLSQRWTIETNRDGLELYKELRELNPSPYLYYMNYGHFEIIGSSPEMLVKQKGEQVFTCPIAGTRPRGGSAEEDVRLKKELLADEKECAEHVMLVDLARNDMGRIAQLGTVKVTDFMKIREYSHVMHIVSMVEGRKKGSFHPVDLINSFLPAGTLSGAPKIRAMEIIDELETVKRGLYGGAIGYIDFNGNMDFCITIRTMVKKGRQVYLQAGAGIVADSVPETEYAECCNKVRALAKVLVPDAKRL
ncbi:MAG: anthranilate synthase component I [Lachnospiraceae bacterium]|nr:anthranilate synthase component I [Lachnospiraceae bacterium]